MGIRGRVIILLLLLILLSVSSVTSRFRVLGFSYVGDPVARVTTLFHAFTCEVNNIKYLFELNISFSTTWLVGYENIINISVTSTDELLTPLRIRASIAIDRLNTSKAGILYPNSILKLQLGIPVLSSVVLLSREREVKPVLLTVEVIEFRCRTQIQLWVVLSHHLSSLEVDVQLSTNPVEIDRDVGITVVLRNPTPSIILDVDLYLIINNTPIYSTRIGMLKPYTEVEVIRTFTPRTIGRYVIEARALYSTPNAVSEECRDLEILLVKSRPRLMLYANTSITTVGRAVLLLGSIEPRTEDEKVVELEVSLDGLTWRTLERIKTDYTINYSWIPTEAKMFYLRFKLIASQTLFPDTSNIVSIAVEKVRPSVMLNIDWPFIRVGSSALIKVSISPPVVDTIELLYRLQNSTQWNRTSIRVDRASTTVELKLDKPGIYDVKAIVPETKDVSYTESNTVNIYVQPIKTENLTTVTVVETPTVQRLGIQTMMILVSIAIAVAFTPILISIRRR